MILRRILEETLTILAEGGIAEARLESELLIRHALRYSKVQMFLALDQAIDAGKEREIDRIIMRRLNGEYLNYITGEREFYGNTFTVNPSVLIPRPETELVVEVALTSARHLSNPVIADVGTGSGAIAISIANIRLDAYIYATDISDSALSVAKENARRHRLSEKINFYQGDLLDPLPEKVDIVTANLPYIPSPEIAETCEPRLALDGGSDGLDVISRLCQQLPLKMKKNGAVILEVGDQQAQAVESCLKAAFPSIDTRRMRDLSGFERVVYGCI